MDGTSGGTVTPPRDEDANSGDFAAVIPLRRRQQPPDAAEATETIEPDSRGIWDPDAPIVDLTERPSLPQQPTATEPLMQTEAPREVVMSGRTATTATRQRPTGRPHLTRRRLATLTVACGFLAMAAVAITVALAGGGHARATHAATVGPIRVHRATAKRTAPAKSAPRAYTRGVSTRATGRPRTVARRSRKPRAVHTALTVSEHRSPSVVAVRAHSPQTPVTPGTSPFQPARALARVPATVIGSGVSSCVPGELGC